MRDERNGLFFIVCFLLLVIILLGFNSALNCVDRNVTREGIVVLNDNNIIKIEDTTGNVWVWEEGKEESITRGTSVRLKMDNKGTEQLEDDEIKKIIVIHY